tara:strand:- start:16756 stop:17721 length:966 start_codon:yes stop_codon:yes gene_type:complete
MKVKIEEKDIIEALKKYIIEIAYRKKEKKRYTKFDSENDTFLGYIGEIAFKRKLLNKGFVENEDVFHISEDEYNNKYIKKINGRNYDEFDFLIDIFYDKNGNKSKEEAFKIDVKTQKYYGKFNENWQFAVNSHTVDKIKENKNRITHFLFIFSQNGLSDIIDSDIEKLNIENLRYLYKNINSFLKVKNFDVDICGIISVNKFLFLSEEFGTGETFRLNINNNKINKFNAKDNMHRIFLKYLDNVDKIIPSRKIKTNINNLKKYTKNFQNENTYVKVLSDNKEAFIPYNKVYLNSQYKDLEELIKKINTNANIENKVGRKLK